MNAPGNSRTRQIRPVVIVLLAWAALAVFAVAGLLSFFHLDSQTTALRRSAMSTIAGRWDTRFKLNVGFFTTALVRWGSHFFNLPPEARAAMRSVSAVQFGVYQLRTVDAPVDVSGLFASADKEMQKRGWERTVGVAKDHEVVAIYLPVRGVSQRRLHCSLLVWNGRQLVILSARGNPTALLELVENKALVSNRLHLAALKIPR